jgi:hypothetical protein
VLSSVSILFPIKMVCLNQLLKEGAFFKSSLEK